jgi:hypothetical protein
MVLNYVNYYMMQIVRFIKYIIIPSNYLTLDFLLKSHISHPIFILKETNLIKIFN